MRSATCLLLAATCVTGSAVQAQTSFGGVEFPQGISSFADRVESNDINISGAGQPTAPHRDATNALGPPDYTGSVNCTVGNCPYVSLGVGGSITLEFVDNRLTGSGSSALDLWIFEVGPQVEDTFVEISKDGITYLPVGKVFGATSGIDIDAFGFGPTDQFRFVRLTDDPAEGGTTGATVGADIDAVGAISSVLVYQITGAVRDLNDSPVPDITVTLSGSVTATATTDALGRYAFDSLAAGGTYTVAPQRPLFTFDPVSQSFPNLSQDEEAAFFVVTSGVFMRYFAEGATGGFFTTEIALLNGTGTASDTIVTFQKPDGTTVDVPVSLNGLDRKTINPAAYPGLEDTALATVIESTQPVIADRTMRWDSRGYGSHTETSIASPLTQWYLAEGATIGGFQLFYLIQNPNPDAAQVQVTYLRAAPLTPLVKTYTVTGSSRFNIWVNVEEFDTPGGPQPLLSAAEFSASITSDRPVIVERAMYLTRNGRQFDAGHESAASPELATTWFLAEGATGPYFDLFALIVNPNPTPAEVEVTYLLPTSSFVKTYPVPGQSRFNIWADVDDPRLADTAVSMALRSTNDVPILVERAMWWPGGFDTWFEGHNSRGAIETGEKWGLADGEVGGPLGLETYVLLANTSPFAAAVQVTVVYEDGTSDVQIYDVDPTSRFNVPMGVFFPGTAGKRFGVVVESMPAPGGTAQIVVERASYNNALLDGQTVVWAAGANAFGTKLR
jgi:hypothetical protein